ncbi:MAG: zinc-binding dehydrogenase [Pseudomonadota bacterium]
MSDGSTCLEIYRHDERPERAIRRVSRPSRAPGPGEALVENHYAGVNAVYDMGLIRGTITRPDATLPTCFGFESVGRVLAVGSDVTELAVGQAVASVGFGRAYRERFTAPAASLVPVTAASPEALTIVPTGASAYLAVTQTGELRDGDRVLVTAAAGGFGHVAVQIARERADTVVAVVGSDAKAERVRALGVDGVINRRSEELDDALRHWFPHGIDLVIDTSGGAAFDAAVRHLAAHGRLVSAGFTADASAPEAVTRPRIYHELYWKAASIRAFMNPLFAAEQPTARDALFDRLAAGQLEIWTHQPVFSGLDAVPEAIECLLAGTNTGKVIVQLTE